MRFNGESADERWGFGIPYFQRNPDEMEILASIGKYPALEDALGVHQWIVAQEEICISVPQLKFWVLHWGNIAVIDNDAHIYYTCIYCDV